MSNDSNEMFKKIMSQESGIDIDENARFVPVTKREFKRQRPTEQTEETKPEESVAPPQQPEYKKIERPEDSKETITVYAKLPYKYKAKIKEMRYYSDMSLVSLIQEAIDVLYDKMFEYRNKQ